MRQTRFIELFEFREKSLLKAKVGKNTGSFPFYTSSPTLSKYVDTPQFRGEHLILGSGGSPSIHYNGNAFAVSSDCFVAFPKQNIEPFNPKYVFYYLYANMQVLQSGFRGAGLKHISKAYLSNISIPLPSFNKQNQLVTVLDKAFKVLECIREIRSLKDRLLESIYFSMFGKKTNGYDQWSSLSLEELQVKKGGIRSGPFGSSLKHSEFREAGPVMVLGIDNVVKNKFEYSNARFITTSKFNKLKSYKVYARDVLISLMGTVGRSAVIPTPFPTAINTKHLAAISLNSKKANPYYISYSVYKNPDILVQVKSKSKGAIMKGLNLGIIKKLKFKCPPIQLQNKFERIFKKIEVSDKRFEKIQAKAEEFVLSIFQSGLKGDLVLNIKAFSFDHQMVDFLEQNFEEEQKLPEHQRTFNYLKRILRENFMNQQQFSFADIQDLAIGHNLELAYEYPSNLNKKGLRDYVFELLEPEANTQSPFLEQLFVLDETRDAEKGNDKSRTVFLIIQPNAISQN